MYLPFLRGYRAEPAARRGRRTRGKGLKLPNLAVQKPRDSQIGVVAELSPGCSCFNYTFHTAISHIMLSEINIYML